ncbi:MAG: hypothetical protein CVU24_17885 [Betaproteobacteria bacterium HGW-Betaproteobacteria-18]|nr:MAG: hypothetical protein CVU24_17885 [Betaproteobacteria bacterium HGW-Betaproteobacteria-18]
MDTLAAASPRVASAGFQRAPDHMNTLGPVLKDKPGSGRSNGPISPIWRWRARQRVHGAQKGVAPHMTAGALVVSMSHACHIAHIESRLLIF